MRIVIAMTKLKPEVKEKFLKALRSGEYIQGKNYLRMKGEDGVTRHCCLGVLGELYQKETENEFANLDQPRQLDQTLDHAVCEWAFDEDDSELYNPALKYNNVFVSASMLNDDADLTFSQIADLFEEQY